MKVLISLSSSFRIDDARGLLLADWKADLKDEEHEDYLPKGYSYNRVVELKLIQASKIGQGYGDKLMDEFLNSPLARKAQLIFLDPNPGEGKFHSSKVPDHVQIAKLQAFYRKHGFRNNPRSHRMWLVQKGTVQDADLPE